MSATNKDKTVEAIAKEFFYVNTMETRRSDSLDFYDCAIWNIKEALEKAYDAGQKAAKNQEKANRFNLNQDA